MNQHERQIIDDLFDKLRQAEQQSGPREPNAEAHIRSRVQQQPGVPYYMAQTILMQEQALQTAQARITGFCQGSRQHVSCQRQSNCSRHEARARCRHDPSRGERRTRSERHGRRPALAELWVTSPENDHLPPINFCL